MLPRTFSQLSGYTIRMKVPLRLPQYLATLTLCVGKNLRPRLLILSVAMSTAIKHGRGHVTLLATVASSTTALTLSAAAPTRIIAH